MCTALLPCPLCSLPRFSDLESLRVGLIKVATENLVCPICNDIFMGLDKLTIHLFSHCDNGIFKPDKIIHDDRQKKEKPTHVLETKTEVQTHVSSIESTFSRTKSKTNQVSLVDESELLNNTCKSEHMMPMYNINTIPFIGIPENLSLLQRNKKNAKCTTTIEKTKNNLKNNKLSEKCDICGFCFLGKNILEMHKKLIHNIQNSEIVNGVSKYCCNLCSKVFKMRGSLMVHLRMVHFGIIPSIKSNESPVQTSPRAFTNTCDGPNCETTINSEDINKECGAKQDFETLITNSRSPEGQDISYNNNVVSSNNTTKQWTCDICKKQFTTKYFLKKHKRLHTGEMPYACNQCNKTFTFQQSYHKHLLYHNDDKPHQCSHCGRAFKELSTLHNHQRIHTGEKPFSCETCGKCFRQRVSYLVHRRIHTGAMPYKCTACEKSFRYKVSQRTHKCTVQPPGTLVRQSGGDLVQKLIRNQKETQNNATNSTDIDDMDQEAINREIKFTQHFTFDSRRNSLLSNNDSSNDNQFLENLCHSVQHPLTDDLICDVNLRPKDVQEREEKNIIDELVNESILRIDFSHPGPSTSHDFNAGVTDLYSMISPQHDSIEDSLPSPSEKFKNLKLSPSSENLKENTRSDGIYETIAVPQVYRISHSKSINRFTKNRNDVDYGVNESQLFLDPIYQRR